jgi:hypothetical protein
MQYKTSNEQDARELVDETQATYYIQIKALACPIYSRSSTAKEKLSILRYCSTDSSKIPPRQKHWC